MLIGDVHGKRERYHSLLKENQGLYDISIQLGDLDFQYDEYQFGNNDFFIGGNHDNWDTLTSTLYEGCPEAFMGRFGTYNDIFYISGAHSIDKHLRTPGLTWWNNEELSFIESQKCLELFKEHPKKIVVSHDGPQCIINKMFHIGDTSHTRILLDACLHEHQPDWWIFGHHLSWRTGSLHSLNLAELNMKTPQEILDTIVEHLLSQAERSEHTPDNDYLFLEKNITPPKPGTMALRGADGCRDTLGIFINHYDPIFESCSSLKRYIRRKSLLPHEYNFLQELKRGGIDLSNNHIFSLCYILQDIHDRHYVRDWFTALYELSCECSLKFNYTKGALKQYATMMAFEYPHESLISFFDSVLMTQEELDVIYHAKEFQFAV